VPDVWRSTLLYNRRTLNSPPEQLQRFELPIIQITTTQMTRTVNLVRTPCSDFPLQHVVDENADADLGRCRAIKVRLAESNVSPRNVSGKVVETDVVYTNPLF
jgi:hypothetical protein